MSMTKRAWQLGDDYFHNRIDYATLKAVAVNLTGATADEIINAFRDDDSATYSHAQKRE